MNQLLVALLLGDALVVVPITERIIEVIKDAAAYDQKDGNKVMMILLRRAKVLSKRTWSSRLQDISINK